MVGCSACIRQLTQLLLCCLLLLLLLQESGITELLMAPGQLCDRLPGCSGTRNLSDNLSDLKAQVSLSGI
jgi:hypothetical protein